MKLRNYLFKSANAVWCRSAHTRLIDKPINNDLRIVTGYLHPTATDNIFILAQASNQLSFTAETRTVSSLPRSGARAPP